jgi:thiamine kinase-like enzyme
VGPDADLRPLSEASTVNERQLRDALAAIEEFGGRCVSFGPVVGGITNTNWRIRVHPPREDFFVKIPGAGTERFIDRRNAVEASRRAAAAGCGAIQRWAFPDTGVEVFEWLSGYRPATNDDFNSPVIRSNSLDGFRAYHQQKPLPQTKTVFDMVEEHLSQIAEEGCQVPPDFAFLHRQYARARQAFDASGYDTVPCFNDGLAANFMVRDDDGDVKLIDFEYSSNNLPHYDIALWMGEMFFDEMLELELIEEFFGVASSDHVARTFVCKAVADLKWASWALVQEKQSDIVFDYRKYGMWKYHRSRAVVHDSRWEGWLRQL